MHRTEILDKLLGVFRDRGFEGATISEIAKAAGLGKASLYHHFPGGKDEMLDCLLATTLTQLNQTVFAPLYGGGDAKDRLLAIIEGFNQYLEGGHRNCLLAVLMMGTSKSRVGDRVQAQVQVWLEQLTELFNTAGMSHKKSARAARDVFVRLHGAAVLSQMMLSDQPFAATHKRLLKEINGKL